MKTPSALGGNYVVWWSVAGVSHHPRFQQASGSPYPQSHWMPIGISQVMTSLKYQMIFWSMIIPIYIYIYMEKSSTSSKPPTRLIIDYSWDISLYSWVINLWYLPNDISMFQLVPHPGSNIFHPTSSIQPCLAPATTRCFGNLQQHVGAAQHGRHVFGAWRWPKKGAPDIPRCWKC